MAVDTDILPPRYRSPKRIGRGGMGEIYRATDDVLGRAVAVKVLSSRYAEDDAVRQRFTREALAAARLSGEQNIVTIFDVGEWYGRPFIVMEYLSGGSLDDKIRESGAQPPNLALAWLEQAALALDAAHRNGVVHRDVKPGNLLLDRDGNVHVADFGIASAAGLDSMTMTGTVLGTAGYLSPEQANGDRATPASDRYALAIVAYELLSGHRPFERESLTAEAAAHVNAPVPSIAERCQHLPEHELDPVFQRALAKSPDDRYPTCGDFVADLRSALMEAAGQTREFRPVAAAAPVRGPAPPMRAQSRPRARWLALGALLAGAAIAGAIVASVLAGGDGDERRAGREREPVTVTQVDRSTVTTEGEDVVVTETTVETVPAAPQPQPQPPASPPPATGGSPPAAPPAASLTEARRLNDQAFALMNQGNYRAALPLAQRALGRLRGSGESYEAYAEYNVGRSLIELGNCREGLQHINRSQQLQGHRREFDTARAKCP